MISLNPLRPLAAALLAGLGLAAPATAQDAPSFRQAPTVAPSKVKGEADAPPNTPDPARTDLLQGPPARWIWGPEDAEVSVFRKTFPGGTKSARLIVAGDNAVTVRLNGRQVASGDNWQEPVEVDVQPFLKDGENELIVTGRNDGGPAGVALKLAMASKDGPPRFVVTDASWELDKTEGAKPRVIGRMGDQPWGDVFTKAIEGASPDREIFLTLPGYKVEKVFTVPRDELGSWVAMTVDPKGRIVVSDQQDKGLCRVTPAPLDGKGETTVERLDLKLADGTPITAAQGLLFAFDSLYLSINGGPGSGLYRASYDPKTDAIGAFEKLGSLAGGGEHGPHALRLSPDKKAIILVCGNHTDPPAKIDASRVPRPWDEDLLLPRQWDANGHARGRMAPGGWVARVAPDGSTWEILSSGYRNSYDMDFNVEGDLFVYDADMEWDIGMPWYRPTRVVHATSGSEFGWRSGTGKWPSYYPDSLPSAVDIGPGSPVGVTFGYGTKFPAKDQKALYILDWTFGTIYAIHLDPMGSTYRGTKTEFLSRSPLPLTDAVVAPDGALYFTIGGRGLQSEMYRVTYVGDESTAPADLEIAQGADLRKLRRELEAYHHQVDDPAKAVSFAYPYLKHADRFLRYAARVAIEHQPVETWQDKVLAETDPQALIEGAIALAHHGDKSLQPKLLAALNAVDFAALDETQQLGLIRAYDLAFIRMGEPSESDASAVLAKFEPYYPSKSDALDRELNALLVYLKSPKVIGKTIALLQGPDQQKGPDLAELIARNAGYGGPIAKMLANMPDAKKIQLAFDLRNARDGWSLDERKAYFNFLDHARSWSGGASYMGFINNIDKDAFENASEADRLAIEATGARAPYRAPELPKPKGPGNDWSLAALASITQSPLSGRDFEGGRRAFAAARCIVCQRFAGEGGATGPDLTQAAGRFDAKALAEAIVEPNRAISDQYRAMTIATTDGRVIAGRVVSESGDKLIVVTDPEDSTKVVELAKADVDEMQPSPQSLMPADLIKPLNEDEVLDLMAYLLSRGDPSSPMFRQGGGRGRRGR